MCRLAGAVLITILIASVFATGANAAKPLLVPVQWLVKKVTIAEAEASHPGIRDERTARFPEAAKPFGFQHAEWEALKAKMLPGDELWEFDSPPASWQDLAGRAGFVLIRGGGEQLSSILTFMN
jgi:hypothetical protein